MSGCMAIGEIRSFGVMVDVVDGGVRMRPRRSEASVIAKAHKPAIIAELNAEVFDGVSYEGSGCYHWIERVYDAAYALSHYGIDVSKALRRLLDLDNAMSESFDREHFDREVLEIREMCMPAIVASGWMLEGHELHDEIKRMVRRDMGAFD